MDATNKGALCKKQSHCITQVQARCRKRYPKRLADSPDDSLQSARVANIENISRLQDPGKQGSTPGQSDVTGESRIQLHKSTTSIKPEVAGKTNDGGNRSLSDVNRRPNGDELKVPPKGRTGDEVKVPPKGMSRGVPNKAANNAHHGAGNNRSAKGKVQDKRGVKDKGVSKGQVRDSKAGKQPDASLKPQNAGKGAKPRGKEVKRGNKSRDCYNCGESGHMSADCQLGMVCRICKSNAHATAEHDKDAVVVQNGPAANNNPRPTQAQALLAELDEANGELDDGDDERVRDEEDGKTPEQIAEAEALAQAVREATKLELKRIDIEQHIRAKMQSLLLHKNLTCAKDRAIVLRSAASIATRDEAHKIPNFDVSQVVTDIYAEELRNVYASRQTMARSIAVETQTSFTIFKNALDCNGNDLSVSQIVTGDPLVVSGSPIARLSYLESLETFGRPKVDTLCRQLWAAGKLTRYVALPAAEEVGKRFINRVATYIVTHNPEVTNLSNIFGGVALTLLKCWAKISGDMAVTNAAGFHVLRFLSKLAYMPGAATLIRLSKFFNPGALLVSLYETRNNPNKLPMRWRLVYLAMRHVGHSLLSSTTLKYGVVGHIAWNALVDLFEAKCALRISDHFKHSPTASPQVTVDKHNGDLYCKDNMSHAAVCLDEHFLKKHPVNPDFQVTPGEALCENKFGTKCSFGLSSVTATVYNPCYHNEIISMNGRVGKLLPAHASPEIRKRIKAHWTAVTNELIEHFDKRIKRVIKPIPVQDWINGFPPAKREMFNGLVENHADLPKQLVASSFVKREIVTKMVDDLTFKDPRFIQGCPPELSLVCGPHLRKFAKNLRSGLAPRVEFAINDGVEESKYRADDVRAGGHIIYTCGMSNQEIGESYSRAIRTITDMCDVDEQVVFLEDDQSRFDLHMGEGAFRFLDRLYRKKLVHKVSSALSRVSREGKNSGRSNLGTKYGIRYTMQSGWPDTSVGDTAVNAVMKISIHRLGRKWISIICGDDSVTVTTNKEIESLGGVDGIVERYADFGMEVEAKLTNDCTTVEFCSGRFLKHGNGFYLVPKVGKLLAKLCWDSVERSPAQSRAWLRSITNTLLMFGQVDPLLKALGVNFRQQLGDGPVLQEVYNEFKHVLRGSVSCGAELDVCEYYNTHYAMSAGDIDACVAHLSSVKIGTLSSCPLLEHMARTDC